MKQQDTIPNQVKLPAKVALDVVLQGIRIRLGRSIVTITGVVCGIAFLMSILTGQIIKKSVAEEDQRREELSRINNFMKADLPSLSGKSFAVVGGGRLGEVEMRLLEQLQKTGIGAMHVSDRHSPGPIRDTLALKKAASQQDLLTAPDIILVMGDGPVPDLDWSIFLERSRNAMVASTKVRSEAPDSIPSERLVLLSREPTKEELDKKALAERQQKFRSVWIGVISLLVTVIGISNAMLMSVTERFREIGTMKCLGALSSFITRIFLIESSLMGLVGGLAGAAGGAVFSIAVYCFTYGPELVLSSLRLAPVAGFGAVCVISGVLLSIVAALYPAWVAASMVPATALRSNV